MISTAQSSTRKGPLEIGDRFLKFEIKGLLGKGGHAWVYHGYDQFLDRHVAIKVIPNPAEPGRDLPRRAQLEARVLCRLQHPNVVHVIDAGATPEGAVYIIMEVLHGRTLREVIHEFQRLNVSEVLSLGAEIADGVQAAHEQNAIHRDLKPENVFILKDNAVKVLDFGIAKFLGYGAATTQKDLLHGTLLYMSPEHLQGFGVTVRSDIFALGTILYEAFVGQPPCMIGVQEPSLNALSWSQINRMPPPLDEFTGTVPAFVARAIQRMVAKEPADRFATMAEVATVLRSNARRFEDELRGASARARELWHPAPVATSPTSATRLTHATTELHELAPASTLASADGLSGDTAPLSRRAFASPIPASAPPPAPNTVAQAAPTLLSLDEAQQGPRSALPVSAPQLQASAAPAAVSAASIDSLRHPALRQRPSVAPISTPLAHADPSPVAVSSARPGRGVVLQLLAAAVGVGTVAGLAVGVAQAHRRPAAAAESASADEPIVVVSTAPPATVAPNPPGATSAASAPLLGAPPAQVASAEPPTGESASTQARPTVIPAASTPARAPSVPTTVATTATARPASVSAPPKTAAKAAAMPASGLWDMSDLDAPAKPKPAPAAASKPRPKPIFGADDIK